MASNDDSSADDKVKETMNRVLLDVVERRRSGLGDKRFHSETSINNFAPEDQPIENERNYQNHVLEIPTEDTVKRRTKSQPGPISEPTLTTALATRNYRRKPLRNVNYAEPLHVDPPTPSPKYAPDEKNMLRLMLPVNARAPDTISEFSVGKASSINGDIRSPETPRRRSITTMDGISMRSTDTIAPPPTSEIVKFKNFSHFFTIIMSSIYAIFLVTLGLIVFISDPFLQMDISTIYCMYLVTVGLAYIIYLSVDIRVYINKNLKIEKIKERHEENLQKMYSKQMEYGQNLSNGETINQIPPAFMKSVDHVYCFSTGRHAGSFYLKMGAAGFALGHLVHCVLLIVTQIGHLMNNNEDCINYMAIVLDFVYPFYSFLQLFFIFKYSNVILLKHKVLGRFGFMHFLGSSLCFWIWTIVRETVDSLAIYAYTQYGNSSYNNDTDMSDSGESLDENTRINIAALVNEDCLMDQAIATVFQNFSPYLYPFTVEYSILIVGIFYIIWHNIGHCPNNDDHSDSCSRNSEEMSCKLPSATDSNNYSSNFVIHADCHASNKGIFGGLVVVVFTIATIIFGFIFYTIGTSEFERIGFWLSDVIQLALNTTMLVAVAVGYNQIRTLDVNEHPISLLDDILLFICIPAFFMDMIFTVVATISILNIVKCLNAIIMTLQAVIQTAFIIEGLRRCSNSKKLRRRKPGRELVMFLLIVNVAMWIFTTFSYKSPESDDERYEFYGKVLWSILNHISLPLCMFYRFHSSVCLADIWESAYKPGSDH